MPEASQSVILGAVGMLLVIVGLLVLIGLTVPVALIAVGGFTFCLAAFTSP